MASSNAEASSGNEYEVFLSFRGPDTRIGFTDMLFHNLTDAAICVFRDDEELRVGERIDGSLWQAISNSKIFIPIFSSTYASSKWCLRELTQIVANTVKSEGNKEILPIFFDVEPNDVKLNNPLYRNAILNLEREKKFSKEEVDEWRKALKESGAIKGWEMKKHKGHGELIKLVVEQVLTKLKTKHRPVTEHLVGIYDQVAAVSKLLDVNFGGVRFVQIYGMGGIGKTTLAKVVFNQLSSDFGKCCCFLEDVQAMSSRDVDLIKLQKKLLSGIGNPIGTKNIDEIDYGMKRIGNALRNKKVLIVLDNVDNSKQVERFLGKSTLHSGTRVLITSRRKDVVQNYESQYQVLYYEMEMMSFDHALELFSRHAFKRDSPSDGYNNLSKEIVYAIGRLPLAVEVIGSLLSHKMRELWSETLDMLRKAPHDNVFNTLKISYEALSFKEKQIFLDIACFFIGEDKTNAIYMWKDCEFFPNNGVAVLINMSLVKIKENNTFWMHDQLRDFGREIVRLENHMNPRERSRLWICEDIVDAIRTNEMNKKVEAIYLTTDPLRSHDIIVQSKEIGRFKHLRFLNLSGGTFVGNTVNCLTELRWISWNNMQIYKWTNMYLENVVVLQFSRVDFLDDSRLQNLINMARKLKVFSLGSCDSITRTPDFSGCPNLERITFYGCTNLRKIDGSIGKLKCLIYLEFHICHCLEDLPEEIGDLMNLQYFNIEWCKVKKLPNSIWNLRSLHQLNFSPGFSQLDYANSWELSSAIGMLQNLEVLLVKCPNLRGPIPSEIGSLHSLKILSLSHTHVSEVPNTVRMLPCLKRLELMGCNRIQALPALPTSLTHLQVSSTSLRVVPDLSNLTNLVELYLKDRGGEGDKLCTTKSWRIGRLFKMTKLSLGLHDVLSPIELSSLPFLDQLEVFGLDLQKLGLDNFSSVVSLSPNLRNLSRLELYGSPMQEFQLDGLQLPHLRELLVGDCVPLERLMLSSIMLKDVLVRDCPKLLEIQFSWVFESLEELSIHQCESLGRLVYVGEVGHDNNEFANGVISFEGRLILPSRALRKLQSLSLGGFHRILEIQVVGTSQSWEHFSLSKYPYVQSLGGLSNLTNMKTLSIQYCNRLQVVEGLNELGFLDDLFLIECGSLERLIDVSTTKLPNDCHIEIFSCKKLGEFNGFIQSFKLYKVSLNGSLSFSFQFS